MHQALDAQRRAEVDHAVGGFDVASSRILAGHPERQRAGDVVDLANLGHIALADAEHECQIDGEKLEALGGDTLAFEPRHERTG